MGSPDLAAAHLEFMAAAGRKPVAVWTQPPKPAGRGQKLHRSEVHEAADRLGIPVYTPRTLRDEAAQNEVKALDLDILVVVAYGLILPAAVLTSARAGAVNVHASLLPRHRGASPIQAAILAGDTATGVTIMQMDEGLDTGDMLMTRRIEVDPMETAGTLTEKISKVGPALLLDALTAIEEGAIRLQRQPEAGASICRKIKKEMARIDWERSAIEIDRLVRAYHPWPLARASIGGMELLLHKGGPVHGDDSGQPGTVVALGDTVEVVTGDGLYRIHRLQRVGRGVLTAAEFLRGSRLAVGDRFA